MPAPTAIAPLTHADLPAALTLQDAIYPAFLREDAPAFASRLDLAASYCLAARRGGDLLGYLLAHGWPGSAPPPVGAILADAGTEVLYLHDLAVAGAARGMGVGRALVDHAMAAARRDGLVRAELIAVEGAGTFWRGMGFADAPLTEALRAKVATYGPAARWMTREIQGPIHVG